MASLALPPNHDSALKLMLKGARTANKQPKVSLTDKTALITGGNSGIGLACAKLLPTLGMSHLILAARSIEKGEAAAASIQKAHPDLKIDVWELDMLSYPSIRAFAERCKMLQRLDIAILNAATGSGQSSKLNPSTGHEVTFQVNYLSTALLAILLLPFLNSKHAGSQPGRLTIVGSGMSLMSSFENRNTIPLIPSFDVPFTGLVAAGERYSVTKTLVSMLVHKLSQVVSANDVIINTVEPGFTSGTELHRDFTGTGKVLMAVLKRLTSRTPEQAAWTYVDAVALKGKESHGGLVMFWEMFAFHRMLYTPEGKQTMEQLWHETLMELEFAGVMQILKSMEETQKEGC